MRLSVTLSVSARRGYPAAVVALCLLVGHLLSPCDRPVRPSQIVTNGGKRGSAPAAEEALEGSAELRPLRRRAEIGAFGGRDGERDGALGGASDLGRVDEAALAAARVWITSPSKMCSRELSSTSSTVPTCSPSELITGVPRSERGVVDRVAVVGTGP